jgi:hypothetical protein
MSTEAINDLKRCVKQYRDVDNELRLLNKTVYEKRETRKMVEMEMCDLIKLPQFGNIDKLKIDDDGSCIKIQRPETYAKAWSLSKKELETLVGSYFQSTPTPNPKDCVEFIVAQRKRALVGKEFEFSRVVQEDRE